MVFVENFFETKIWLCSLLEHQENFMQFPCLQQVNEDSNNRRPIMLEITPPSPAATAATAAPASTAAAATTKDQNKPQTETEKSSSEPEKAKTTEQQKPGMVKYIVEILLKKS